MLNQGQNPGVKVVSWHIGKADMRAARYEGSTPSRIVVRGVNWVGDTIMSLPAARALRRLFPAAHIVFWVPANLEPLLRLTEVPDEIIVFKKNEGGSFKRTFMMKDRLQKGYFDMAVLFQNAFECAFTAWMAGIKLRVGYPTDLRGALLNIKAPLIPSILLGHQVFYYLEIVKYLDSYFGFGRFQYFDKPDCSIKLRAREVYHARDIILESGADPKTPFVCLCPGSVNSEAKRWPREHYAVLADILIERAGLQIIFLGATQEADLIDSIIGEMMKGPAFNLAAKSSIVSSLGIMNMSSLVISNDTGSAHLAVAAGAKCLTIFGPTIAGATAPFGNRTFIIQGKAECAPCNDHNCRFHGHPCMKGLSPEPVSRKALEIVALHPSV